MTTTRRSVLAGIAGLGVGASVPAWAQAIGPQSDPWAQVDPYADPRNGFPGRTGSTDVRPANRDGGPFTAPAGAGIDEKEEIELGRAMYPAMVRDGGGAYPDAKVQAALRAFARPLFAVADRSGLPWEVTLVNNPSPNAGAFAGGKVIVHTGLLPLCDAAGELAATLAHEIGHVDKRHTARSEPMLQLVQNLRQQGAAADMNIALSQLIPGANVRDVWEVFRLAYSRADETEADAHEMVILERRGVDPIHAVHDQENFLRLNGGGDDRPELAMTHPRDADRLSHIKMLAASQARPAQDYVFPGWDVLKAAFPTRPEFKKT